MNSQPTLTTVISERMRNDAVIFGILRGLALGGIAACFIIPVRPEHQVHLPPVLLGFIVYNAALVLMLVRWTREARLLFVAALGVDLTLVFLLVWLTGGGQSPFYLVFYLLVTLNAYYFGAGIGVLAAGLASGLLAGANWLAPLPDSWAHVGRARRGRDQPGPRSAREGETVPGRSLLPTASHHRAAASVEGAPGGWDFDGRRPGESEPLPIFP